MRSNPASKIGVVMMAMVVGLASAPVLTQAAVVRVGNGDDGADLEGLTQVTSGPIIAARDQAVTLLKKMDVEGISGLGFVIPELERSVIYRAERDVPANLDEDQGTYHTDMRGLVFARTFAEPHAATRLFPVAQKLDQDQLVSLLVHEALHRALPESVRENERRVAALTLAMTAPGATHDRIKVAAKKYIPKEDANEMLAEQSARAAQPTAATSQTNKYPVPEDAKINRPSTFAYTYQRFHRDQDTQTTNIVGMHSVESFLYPFGSDENPIGVGIAVNVINTEKKNHLGPLGLSGRTRLWSSRGFDVGGFVNLSLNTLSDEDLKNTPFGRDITTLGLSMRKETSRFYLENALSYSLPSESKRKISNSEYTYRFGSIVSASVGTGLRFDKLRLGGVGEILLSDYFRVNGGGSSAFDSGRYQIVSAGPEISYDSGIVELKLFGKFIVSSSSDMNFDSVGNLLGEGVGQGSVGATLGISL